MRYMGREAKNLENNMPGYQQMTRTGDHVFRRKSFHKKSRVAPAKSRVNRSPKAVVFLNYLRRFTCLQKIITMTLISLLAVLLAISVPSESAQSRDLQGSSQSERARQHQQANNDRQIFMPVIHFQPKPTILTGIYPQGYPGNQSTIDNEFKAIDDWVGQKLSIGGTFIDLEWPNPRVNFKGQMEVLWNNGYTPFVNLTTNRSAAEVANGAIDSAIEAMASAYAEYAQGNTRMAYLAPFPEMNGEWVPYKLDPENYKRAFTRIQTIFARSGVPDEAVRWVFAPNGWSRPGTPGFESYYPGDSAVDIVSFSGYNFGYHPFTQSGVWQNPPDVYGPYLVRMRAMAPSKPIFIAQTGTSAYTSSGPNADAKNRWLRDAYQYLADSPGVRGIIYFNKVNQQGVDWPFYVANDPSQQYPGYREGVLYAAFGYLSPAELKNSDLSP
jgi:type II secretory pathway pseudopilin PulG